MPSGNSSTCTPNAVKPEAMAAMRSLSLTRSSAASRIVVMPSASAAAMARMGASSINRGMIVPPNDIENGVRSITTIQIKLKDFANAEVVTDRLRAAFPPNMYQVRTWEQKQGPLLAAVDVESTILNVLLFMIIAVAGFGILAIFSMIVVEKTRDIGILKALGASNVGVMKIFLGYGLLLGIVGAGLGMAVGPSVGGFLVEHRWTSDWGRATEGCLAMCYRCSRPLSVSRSV